MQGNQDQDKIWKPEESQNNTYIFEPIENPKYNVMRISHGSPIMPPLLW